MIVLEKPTFIYIMGAGRSGSTILGIMLGNLPDCIYTGELHFWNIYKGIPNNDQEEVKNFWAKVKQDFTGCEKYFDYNFYKYLEYHTSFLFLPWLTKSKLITEYLLYNSELAKRIINKSDKKIIIDSSHYPFRALMLHKNKCVDLKVIYLYRNPINVLNSFQKKNIEHNPKHPLMANIYLFLVSSLSTLSYFILPRNNRIKIRFEDVLSKPDIMIKELTDFLGFPDCKLNFNNLSTGYSIQSNRIRQSMRITLRQDENEGDIKPFWKIFTKIVQSPFLFFNKSRLK